MGRGRLSCLVIGLVGRRWVETCGGWGRRDAYWCKGWCVRVRWLPKHCCCSFCCGSDGWWWARESGMVGLENVASVQGVRPCCSSRGLIRCPRVHPPPWQIVHLFWPITQVFFAIITHIYAIFTRLGQVFWSKKLLFSWWTIGQSGIS